MTTISGTLTGESNSSLLTAYNKAEEVDYTITGPFGAKVAFETSNPGGPGHMAVKTLKQALLSQSGRIHLEPNTRLRLRLVDVIVAITNGTFAADTDWTKGAGWTIAGGVGVATGAISTAISQSIAGLVVGASYDVTYTITRSAGSIAATLGGGSAGASRSTSATFTDTLVAGATLVLAFTGTGFTGTIDNVTISPKVVYTFSDTDAILEERKDGEGVLLAQWLQSGLSLLKALTVAGTTTFLGSIVSTGAAVINGLTLALGGRVNTNVAASTALSNTVTETIFDNGTATIPANTLKAGSTVKVRFQGIATSTNSTDTLQVRLMLNGLAGTALITIPATDATNNDIFTGEYLLQFRAIGATGKVVGVGLFKSIPGAEGTITVKDDFLAEVTIDTTAAITIDCAGKWSVASASNSCRLDVFHVEVD